MSHESTAPSMTCPVVIAGGGPTGMMLAAELKLAGLDPLIVEPRAGQTFEGTRARGLHARTIEVLDQRGIGERFVAAGQPAQIINFARVPLSIDDWPTRRPYGLALVQQQTERLLAEWIAELGVRQRRGVAVTGFAQDAAGVDVALSDGTSLRAGYLVGCDGGRSTVRKAAGIPFEGWPASISYLIAEVWMTETPPFGVRRDERGIHAIGPMGGGQVAVVLREEQVGRRQAPTLDEVRAGLVALYGSDFGLERASWLSWFTDASRQATRYRAGRVLLAGDATNIHTPMGGQGLNTGVQDAVNLGWKLGLVARGLAPESLLDSYHAERHPVGARVLRNTMALTALDRVDPHVEAARGVFAELMQAPEARARVAGMMSGLDLRYDLGEGHPLLGRRVPDLDLDTAEGPRRVFELLHGARPALLDLSAGVDPGPWADRVTRVEARCAGPWVLPVVGPVAAPTALLIRPDGYVAWVGEESGAAGLADALKRWFGPAKSSADGMK